MSFINRKSELETLENLYCRETATMVVIYGRRRVGKTSLIKEFLKERDSIYFLATQEREEENLATFKRLVAKKIGNQLLTSAEVSWDQVFELAVNHSPDSKLVIVIDEFQYLGVTNPAFPSILQRIWDTILIRSNVMLILCGSLISLMKSQTLDYGSPLYGRRNAQIRLQPLSFNHFREFFGATDANSLVPLYAVTGGVPKYIEEFINTKGDLYEMIEKRILTVSGFLYEEPFFLLSREVNEIGSYFSLLRAIAQGNHKLAAITSILGVKQTSLTKYLKVLIDLDLVTREVPITQTNPEKSRKGLYKIKDNFIAFWFAFVYPYMSYLEQGETGYVKELIKERFVVNFASTIYEDVCRQKMWDLNSQGFFGIRFTRLGRHWGGTIGEIDIVALDDHGGMIVGECKYSIKPQGVSVLKNLELKSHDLMRLTGSEKVTYVIFCPAGFDASLAKEAKERNDIFLISDL